jgi:glycosyltransferase involved in cell wall biosynthesis
MSLLDRSRLAVRLLLGEGPGSVVRRLLDRAEERRRRESFPEVDEEKLAFRAAVLNMLPTLPAPRLGGVQTGFLHRLEQEGTHRPVALLYPSRGGYRLETEDRGRRAAVTLPGPAPPATPALRDPAFEAVVQRGARLIGASTVHVENLAGLAPGSVAALPRNGLQLIVTVQDFSPFCPRPHLLEQPADAFCNYCTDPDRCWRCLADSWQLDPAFLEEYRRLAAEAMRSAAAVVYLSVFLRERLAALVPGLDPERQHVIAPSSSGSAVPKKESPRSDALHAAFVGAVKPHKGALVFEQVVRAARGRSSMAVRWSAYGGGDTSILRRLRALGVSVHGYYRADSLPDLLRRDGVDVALVLSIWPETYTLVVDECLLAGVPVVAFDMGAPAERLRGGRGLLIPAEAGADGVLQALASARSAAEAQAAAVPPAPHPAQATLALYARLGL